MMWNTSLYQLMGLFLEYVTCPLRYPVRYLVQNPFHKQRYIEINMRKHYIVLKTLEALKVKQSRPTWLLEKWTTTEIRPTSALTMETAD